MSIGTASGPKKQHLLVNNASTVHHTPTAAMLLQLRRQWTGNIYWWSSS